MFCAISGTVPEEPVLSKTGYLFEKKLILKHIEATGKCPITNETLTPDDLTPIKTSSVVKPRPTTATSIPSMLHMFQNEWDAVMLECFALKQNLEQVRQELAHALYQNDAACRVIARLVKERDAARSALANAQAQLSTASHAPATSGNASAMEVEAPTRISDEIKEKMTALSKQLSQQRKKRAPPATLAQIPDIEQFKERSSHPVHKSNLPGITCLDIHPTNPHVTITGGVDKTAVVFNEETGKKTATLSGHAKKVTQVLFHPTEDLVFTASSDKTARVWKQQAEAYDTASVIKTHSGAVVALTLHPLGDYIVTASADCTWGFHDIHSGACLSLVSDQSGKAGYQCASFHPDGLILATGTADSMVRIWDVKSQGNVANFEGHRGSISSLAFSENGYILATAADDATVKLWDLRKLKNFHTLDLGGVVANLHFDFSGSYLGAAAGNDIKIYNTKSLEIITTLSGHSDAVTALKFGPDASFIASTSMDRSLKFWSKS